MNRLIHERKDKMGDIYISGNGRRNQDTQDIPIQPQRVPTQNVRRQQPNGNLQPSPQRPNNQKPKAKKKKKSSFGKAIFVLLMVVVVIFAGFFGVIYNTASKIDYNENGHKDNVYVDNSSLMQDKNEIGRAHV